MYKGLLSANKAILSFSQCNSQRMTTSTPACHKFSQNWKLWKVDPVKRGFTTFPCFLSSYIWVKTVTQKRHLKVHKKAWANSVDEHKNTKSTQENTKGTLF